MRWSRRAVLTAAGAAVATTATRAGPASAMTVDPIEQAAVAALEAGAAPGCDVGVARAGQPAYARGFGYANLELRSPLTSDSVLRIGSLTKQFTAAAAIKLASQGRLDLGAPVATWLPAFNGRPDFSVLEALHQTAGLHSDEGEGEEAVSAAAAPVSQTELAARIAGQTKVFDFEPGAAWLYSNANYIVVGAVIEQVCGKPLSEAMSDLIFAPLGLTSSAFDEASAVVAGRASGYSAGEAGDGSWLNAAWLDPSQAGGAGAMRSTVGDLCRWHDQLLTGALFDAAHVALMLAPGRLRDGRLSSANRFSPDDAGYGDTEYACGLLVSGPSEPRRNILHYGAINGFCSVLQTWVDDRVTFAALLNADIGPAAPFRALRRAVIEAWLAPST